MRTTVDLDNALIERAKRLGLKEGRSLSAIVNVALAAYLGGRKDSAKDPRFELIVRGKPGGRFPTPGEIDAAQESDELDALAISRVKNRVAP